MSYLGTRVIKSSGLRQAWPSFEQWLPLLGSPQSPRILSFKIAQAVANDHATRSPLLNLKRVE